jgi:DNA-binding transcriptional regulator of glucitol operon
MRRRVRGLLALAVVLTAVAVMLRLSLWQWDRARAGGRLLNYTYAVEWLLFALLTPVGVIRLALEGRRAGDAAEPQERGGTAWAASPVKPQVGPPLREGEELEELTWVRLRRRLGLGGR